MIAQKLNNEFLESIIWMKKFKLDYTKLELELLCIKNNEEIFYKLNLIDVIQFQFRNDNVDEDFNVIDVFFEKFNDCPYLQFMKSDKFNDYWAMRFHEGNHHMVVGFKKWELNLLIP